MLRLIVTDSLYGRTLIDSVGSETLIEMLAAKYRRLDGYIVRVLYP